MLNCSPQRLRSVNSDSVKHWKQMYRHERNATQLLMELKESARNHNVSAVCDKILKRKWCEEVNVDEFINQLFNDKSNIHRNLLTLDIFKKQNNFVIDNFAEACLNCQCNLYICQNFPQTYIAYTTKNHTTMCFLAKGTILLCKQYVYLKTPKIKKQQKNTANAPTITNTTIKVAPNDNSNNHPKSMVSPIACIF